jgi:outer membrane murein-binding lipoprotein Lpp
MKRMLQLTAFAASAILVSGCNSQPKAENTAAASSNTTAAVAPSANDPVSSAESAAPASIAHNASIVTMDANGAVTVVRKGSNGWTCIPDSPATPGPDPMCADANAMKWADAWIHHKTPPGGTVGLMYMLEGGTDASNTDPYADKPTSTNNWVKTGPHIMVVGSKEILAGYPSGPSPDTSGPYVMWAGTPYAHLMVPIGK